MKKVLIFFLILVAAISFSSVVYTNAASEAVWYDGELVEVGDTITVDFYMFDDAWEYSSGYVPYVFSSESTSVATTTTLSESFTALMDAKLSMTVASATWYVYLNSLSANPVAVTSTYELLFDTTWVKDIYFKTTSATTTSISYQIYYVY